MLKAQTPVLKVLNFSLKIRKSDSEETLISSLAFNLYDSMITVLFSKDYLPMRSVFNGLKGTLKRDSFIVSQKIKVFDNFSCAKSDLEFLDKNLFLVDSNNFNLLDEDQTIENLLRELYKNKHYTLNRRFNGFVKRDRDLYEQFLRERNDEIKMINNRYLEEMNKIVDLRDSVINNSKVRLKKARKNDIEYLKLNETIKEAERKYQNAMDKINKEHTEKIKTSVSDWNKKSAQLCSELKKSHRRAKIDNDNYIKSMLYNSKLQIDQLKQEMKLSKVNPQKVIELKRKIKNIKVKTKNIVKVSRKDANIYIITLLREMGINKPFSFLNKTKEGLTSDENKKLQLAYAILQKYKIIMFDDFSEEDNNDQPSDTFKILERIRKRYRVSFLYCTDNREILLKARDCYRVVVYKGTTVEMGFIDFRINESANSYVKSVYSNNEYTPKEKRFDNMQLRKINGEHYMRCTIESYREIIDSLPRIVLEPKIKSHKII